MEEDAGDSFLGYQVFSPAVLPFGIGRAGVADRVFIMHKIKRGEKQEKPFHESILQIGNRDDMGQRRNVGVAIAMPFILWLKIKCGNNIILCALMQNIFAWRLI